MTAKAGMFVRFQSWVGAWFGKAASELPADPLPGDRPLVKLPRLLIGIAGQEGRKHHGLQLMVDAMNEQHMTCKCRELLEEGQIYHLGLLLQGVGHVKFEVEVEWVLLSSYGHSAGLRIRHTPQTEAQLRDFLQLLELGSRG